MIYQRGGGTSQRIKMAWGGRVFGVRVGVSVLMVAGCSAFPATPASSSVLLAFHHCSPMTLHRGARSSSQAHAHPAGIPGSWSGGLSRHGSLAHQQASKRLLLRGGMGLAHSMCSTATPDSEENGPSRDERKAIQQDVVNTKLAAIASGEKGLGKVRQHVNPLKSQFQVPTQAPDWSEAYRDPSLPMHLDIGCGKGRFILELAAIKPDVNHFGVEIREPLVVRANRWAKEADIGNCFFSFANMNASIKTILKGYPGTISLVTILMPDPWFKSRHHKRRVVQPEFVDSLAEEMPIGSKLIIGSDVHDVFQDIVWVLGNTTTFTAISEEGDEWPLERQTERQISCQSRGEALYHAVYKRT